MVQKFFIRKAPLHSTDITGAQDAAFTTLPPDVFIAYICTHINIVYIINYCNWPSTPSAGRIRIIVIINATIPEDFISHYLLITACKLVVMIR